MSPATAMLLMGAALVSVSHAQFLQDLSAGDPALALQPPPLHQAAFPTFSQPAIIPASQSFLQPAPALRPLPIARQQQQPQVLAHHAVVRNAEDESRLPDELRNNFYKNPRIAEALAKESWFIPGEEQVLEREAEKIPRDQIAKLLRNAGLARRR